MTDLKYFDFHTDDLFDSEEEGTEFLNEFTKICTDVIDIVYLKEREKNDHVQIVMLLLAFAGNNRKTFDRFNVLFDKLLNEGKNLQEGDLEDA